ncbi:MAG TPA: hypothetical protein VLG08_11440 [Casimicrobiaceae bacterium]|nr:hypothetical protein [Casimicrobiaceae bacterium]
MELHAFAEQPHGLAIHGALQRAAALGVRDGQRGHPIDDLTRYAKRLAAGDDDRYACAPPQHRVGQLRARREQVLGIVEHQEQTHRAQVLGERLQHRLAGLLLQSERRDRRLGDEIRIPQRGELDEPCAIAVAMDGALGDAQRESRLADAAGARERQQAARR